MQSRLLALSLLHTAYLLCDRKRDEVIERGPVVMGDLFCLITYGVRKTQQKTLLPLDSLIHGRPHIVAASYSGQQRGKSARNEATGQ